MVIGNVDLFMVNRYKPHFTARIRPKETKGVPPGGAVAPNALAEKAKPEKRRRLRPALLMRVAIAVSLVGVIFFRIGWQPVLESFTDVAWLWIIAVLLLVPLDRLLATVRWQILLRALGVRVTTIALFKRTWTAGLFNSILPGQFGGDFYRVLEPWEIPLKKTAIGSSVLVDRVTGIIGLLFMISLVGTLEFGLARELGVAFVPAVSTVGVILLLGMVTLVKPLTWLRRTLVWWPANRPRVLAEEIIDSMLIYSGAKWSILGAVIISLVFRLVKAAGTYFVFLAIGIDVPFETVLFVSLLIQTITLVPITINGWGIREGSYVFLFTQLGVASSEVLAAVLLGRVLGLFTTSILGLSYITSRRKLRSAQMPGAGGFFTKFNTQTLVSALRRIYHGLFRHDQWSIGVIDAPIHTFLEPNARPKPHYLAQGVRSKLLADPFGIKRGEKLTILCEEFDYKSPRGLISSIEFDGESWSDGTAVAMDQPFHMSYPYLIEHQGEIYCVPETHEAREVALYRAEDFPHRWAKVATLLEDIPAVDSAVFQYEGLWWLTCTNREHGQYSDLLVWYASDLFGPWRPHAANPVKTDICSARPGGTPFIHQGCLYRPAQDCSQTYGGRIILNRVLRLTPTEFEEEPAAIIEPYTDGPFPHGIHTISAVGDITLIDGKRFVFITSALKLELMRRLKLGRHWMKQRLGRVGSRPDPSRTGG